MFRAEAGLSLGLGKGFQLGLKVPLDVKHTTIAYSLPDGTEYVPPYGNTHHRNETLVGLGDIRLVAWHLRRIEGTPVLLGAGLGLAFPTGKTEDNPFTEEAANSEHQHLQFGNGTVDPLVRLQVILSGPNLGLVAQGTGRVPVYDNQRGYRGSIMVRGAIGPSLRLPAPVRGLQFLLLIEGNHMAAEYWDGEAGENSGFRTLGFSFAVNANITPNLALLGQFNWTPFEVAEGAQMSRPFQGTLGLSGTLPAPGQARPQP